MKASHRSTQHRVASLDARSTRGAAHPCVRLFFFSRRRARDDVASRAASTPAGDGRAVAGDDFFDFFGLKGGASTRMDVRAASRCAATESTRDRYAGVFLAFLEPWAPCLTCCYRGLGRASGRAGIGGDSIENVLDVIHGVDELAIVGADILHGARAADAGGAHVRDQAVRRRE